jgi:chorismate-pyruvate lyase
MISDIDQLNVRINALQQQFLTLHEEVRHMQKQLSTLGSPWWRRVLFRLDGWPPWWIVAERPKWRPWRRWWRS